MPGFQPRLTVVRVYSDQQHPPEKPEKFILPDWYVRSRNRFMSLRIHAEITTLMYTQIHPNSASQGDSQLRCLGHRHLGRFLRQHVLWGCSTGLQGRVLAQTQPQNSAKPLFPKTSTSPSVNTASTSQCPLVVTCHFRGTLIKRINTIKKLLYIRLQHGRARARPGLPPEHLPCSSTGKATGAGNVEGPTPFRAQLDFNIREKNACIAACEP